MLTDEDLLIQCEIEGEFASLSIVFSIDQGKSWSEIDMTKKDTRYIARLPIMPIETEVRYFYKGVTLDGHEILQGSHQSYYLRILGQKKQSDAFIEEKKYRKKIVIDDINFDEKSPPIDPPKIESQFREGEEDEEDEEDEEEDITLPTHPLSMENMQKMISVPFSATMFNIEPNSELPSSCPGCFFPGKKGEHHCPICNTVYNDPHPLPPEQLFQVPPNLQDLVQLDPHYKMTEELKYLQYDWGDKLTLERMNREMEQKNGRVSFMTTISTARVDFQKKFTLLAQDREDQKKYPEVLECRKQAVLVNPRTPWVWLNLGTAFNLLKDKSRALRAVEYAIHLYPNEPKSLKFAFVMAKDLDQIDKASAFEQQFLKLSSQATEQLFNFNPDNNQNPELLLKMAKRALAFNELDLADTLFSQAIKTMPSNAEAWFLYGRVKYKKREDTHALQAYLKILTLPNLPDDDYLSDVYGQIGIIYMSQHEYIKAIEALEKSLTLYDKDPQIYFFLGFAYIHQHQDDKATLMFTRLLRISKDEAQLKVAKDCLQQLKDHSPITDLEFR